MRSWPYLRHRVSREHKWASQGFRDIEDVILQYFFVATKCDWVLHPGPFHSLHRRTLFFFFSSSKQHMRQDGREVIHTVRNVGAASMTKIQMGEHRQVEIVGQPAAAPSAACSCCHVIYSVPVWLPRLPVVSIFPDYLAERINVIHRQHERRRESFMEMSGSALQLRHLTLVSRVDSAPQPKNH